MVPQRAKTEMRTTKGSILSTKMSDERKISCLCSSLWIVKLQCAADEERRERRKRKLERGGE